MKSFLLWSLLILAATFCHAQAKSVYFELGGPGIASFNFDSRFTKSEAGIGGRAGIGGFSIDGETVVFLPLGVNYLVGKDNRNYFEIGAGVTPVLTNIRIFSNNDENFRTTFGHLLFGYRLQPLNGGFSFRAFINPVFGKGFFLPYYAGLSFGYKF